MRNEILAYDEPLLIYLVDRETAGPEELLESVAEMKDRLVERRSEDVYKARGTILNPAVVPLAGATQKQAPQPHPEAAGPARLNLT